MHTLYFTTFRRNPTPSRIKNLFTVCNTVLFSESLFAVVHYNGKFNNLESDPISMLNNVSNGKKGETVQNGFKNQVCLRKAI